MGFGRVALPYVFEGCGSCICFVGSRYGNSPHASPQPIQSRGFNLPLDKYDKLLYSLVKVPLTVSPFRPSFKPPSGVYSPPSKFVPPLFSWSYKLLFPQTLCFDNLLRCPPGCGSAPSQLCGSAFSYPLPPCSLSTFRMNTCKSVSKQRTLTPFRMNTCEGNNILDTQDMLCDTLSMSTPVKLPKTLQEAVSFFSDPQKTFDYAVSLRWPTGEVTCPRCESTEHSFISTRRLWFCKGCKKQFTVKVGTIFEDSALGMDKWMIAVWLIVNTKNGISSYEVARALGITQKSAWFMMHRIRLALH